MPGPAQRSAAGPGRREHRRVRRAHRRIAGEPLPGAEPDVWPVQPRQGAGAAGTVPWGGPALARP